MVAARGVAHVVGETTSSAVTLVESGIRAAAWGITAVIGAIAAMASIPYVGPILAVAAAAGMVALVAGEMHAFEAGGRPEPGQLALVGERGPELFIPDVAGTIIPAHQTAAMLQGGGSRAAGGGATAAGGKSNISVYGFTDPDQMAQHIQRNDDHEKWVVDVMRRNIHKFRG